jgi:uncharacterized protein YndB with AHSA1/START domain
MTSDQLADATVVPDGDAWTLIFVRVLRHPPKVVWAALTDPAELDRWAPFAASRDLGATGGATLTMIDGDQRDDLPATVQRAEAPRLLEYTWGDDLLRWLLEPDGEGTRLTLRHTLRTPGIQDQVAAGWHLCFDQLDQVAAGRPVAAIRGKEALAHGWEDLRARYAEKFRR